MTLLGYCNGVSQSSSRLGGSISATVRSVSWALDGVEQDRFGRCPVREHRHQSGRRVRREDLRREIDEAVVAAVEDEPGRGAPSMRV